MSKSIGSPFVSIGAFSASLSNIFNGKTNPTNNHVSAIHRRFPDININWLMFGEGDMYTTVSDETKDGVDGGESTIGSDAGDTSIALANSC